MVYWYQNIIFSTLLFFKTDARYTHVPDKLPLAHYSTVESAYFEVIRIKKGLRIIQNSNYQNTQRKRGKKMWMTDQKCRYAGGWGQIQHLVVALLQTPACNIGGQTHTHTGIAVQSIALHVFCFKTKSLEKCFHCVRIKKSRQNRFELTGSLFQNSN